MNHPVQTLAAVLDIEPELDELEACRLEEATYEVDEEIVWMSGSLKTAF